jgi:hypothetical protein
MSEEVATMMLNARDDQEKALLVDLGKRLFDLAATNDVYVCSFSEEGDDLSQWRAYGGIGGFSVGFSAEFLRNVTTPNGFLLTRCLYIDAEQREAMRGVITDILDHARYIGESQMALATHSGDGQGSDSGRTLVQLTLARWRKTKVDASLNQYAPFLKHGAFSAEKEWRIIVGPHDPQDEHFDLRAGGSVLIPYYKVPLNTESEPFRIEEIVVGPTPHKEQAVRSVLKLLEKYGVKGELTRHKLGGLVRREVPVRNTAIPYRDW